jgi:HAD superfamily hydrolase (TIGR01509 family)
MREWGLPAAIVFDLDGTLVDTVQARIDAWRAALGERGFAVDDDRLRPMIGMDGRRLAAELTDAERGDPMVEELDRRSGELFDERNRRPMPLPGVRELLGRLDEQGITWAIATSSRAEQVTASVDALDLPRKPRIVDGSAVRNAKPAPDLLLESARQLRVEPERTWYVGDSTWDMRAARAADMRAIGVTAGAAVSGGELAEAGAQLVISTLNDLAVG